MAVVLTSDGKIAQFAGNPCRPNISAAETLRYLECGVYTLVREGRCRAIGIPFDITASGGADSPVRHTTILLEHRDGLDTEFKSHIQSTDRYGCRPAILS